MTSGTELGMNEKYTFPTFKYSFWVVGRAEEAGREKAQEGPKQCAGGSREKPSLSRSLKISRTWKVASEGQVMGAVGAKGCRPEVEYRQIPEGLEQTTLLTV